jgi:hypothetical protein
MADLDNIAEAVGTVESEQNDDDGTRLFTDEWDGPGADAATDMWDPRA